MISYKILSQLLIYSCIFFTLLSCRHTNKRSSAMKADSTQTNQQSSSRQTVKSITIKVAHKEPYGAYLSDGNGRSLYLFMQDTTSQSTCYQSCAATWPPVIVEDKKAVKIGDKVDQSKLGTTQRQNGTLQMTYNHHPLYYYIVDQKAGQFSGQNINQYGAKWYLVTPKGEKIDDTFKK